MAANPNAQRLAELAALVDAVKERVRTQYPGVDRQQNAGGGLRRTAGPDAAGAGARCGRGKDGGDRDGQSTAGRRVNSLVQAVKRSIARGLNWFVRDQVLFNRQMITCVETCIETLNDINRTIHLMAGQANLGIQRLREEIEPLRREAGNSARQDFRVSGPGLALEPLARRMAARSCTRMKWSF